jgi:hypothetical protein
LLFVPVVAREGRGGGAVYFAVLGAAFMLVEIPLLQKFILYVGHPTLAVSVVLCALLAGGALGSRLSGHRTFAWRKGERPWPTAVVAAYGLLGLPICGGWLHDLVGRDRWVRIAASVLVVLPLGVFMGMPFPLGIVRAARQKRQRDVPLYWAINGAAAVVGSAAAVTLSLYAGLSAVIALGAALYLVLFAVFEGA